MTAELEVETTTAINQAALDFIARGPKRLLIDGQWVPAASGRTFDTISPVTERVLAQIAEGDQADVDLAVKAARRAFEDPSWASISPYERERYLNKIADLMETHADELATLETLDSGMPLLMGQHAVAAAVKAFRYFSGWPTKIYGKTNPTDGSAFTYTVREPLGVCAAIIPWNGPLMLSAWKIAPALAFGNTLVVKPAELTSLSILRLGELMLEAGLPAGVVNIVAGYGHTAGAALVAHPDVNKIAFTGSTAVGKGILRTAADTLKKVTLELGGKSPVVIFPDADLDKAIQLAVMGFTLGTGQICVAGTRVFVHESIYEEVAAKITAIVSQLKSGDSFDASIQMGPIISRKQRDNIESYFDLAKAEGATAATGGEKTAGQGFFVQPTVFTHVTNNMRLAQEEIFGPVVVLIPFKDEADVVLQSNDTEYGLAATVWTNDLNRAHRLAKSLKAGTIWVNTTFELDPISPFGGYKQSGTGRELGEESVDAYTQIKSVMVRF